MVDKSIPYFNVIMKRSAGKSIPNFILPDGYSFVWFSEGKEQQWAEIETSVEEFSNIKEALHYFQNEYLPFVNELGKRLLFIQNEEGNEVGEESFAQYKNDYEQAIRLLKKVLNQ